MSLLGMNTTGNRGGNRHSTVVTTLNPCDVLMGRGASAAYYEGNVAFREMVRPQKKAYRSAVSQQRKQEIARNLYDEVKRLGGRFLSPMDQTEAALHGLATGEKAWYIVDDGTALEKIKQALREKDSAPTSLQAAEPSEPPLSQAAAPLEPDEVNFWREQQGTFPPVLARPAPSWTSNTELVAAKSVALPWNYQHTAGLHRAGSNIPAAYGDLWPLSSATLLPLATDAAASLNRPLDALYHQELAAPSAPSEGRSNSFILQRQLELVLLHNRLQREQQEEEEREQLLLQQLMLIEEQEKRRQSASHIAFSRQFSAATSAVVPSTAAATTTDSLRQAHLLDRINRDSTRMVSIPAAATMGARQGAREHETTGTSSSVDHDGDDVDDDCKPPASRKRARITD